MSWLDLPPGQLLAAFREWRRRQSPEYARQVREQAVLDELSWLPDYHAREVARIVREHGRRR